MILFGLLILDNCTYHHRALPIVNIQNLAEEKTLEIISNK